jgi:hypothetical protein
VKTTNFTSIGGSDIRCASLLITDEQAHLSTNSINVTIHYPDSVSDSVRQRKINAIYDILKPIDDN